MSRIISVSDEVYAALRNRKNGKSFSETIKALYKKPCKTPLDVIAGWNASKGFVESLEKSFENRKKARLKRVEF